MKTLLLLHGAIGSEDQLMPIKNLLAETYEVHTLNFSGHGGQPMEKEFSIPQFAKEVLEHVAEMKIEQVSIFGYSMGGYVALYLAKKHPQLIESVITLGTKLYWSERNAEKESSMLQPDLIERKVPKFADQLKEIHHPENWKLLLERTAAMLKQMGFVNPVSSDDFQKIASKVLLIIGDRDKTATLDETVDVYKKLTSAQLAVLPDTPHAIERVNIKLLKTLINNFMK